MSQRAALLTAPFRRVVLATFLCFAAFGATLPVLPRFVVEELGRGETTVGLVFGVHALAAVLVRPAVGRIGDRSGRRPLIIAGAVLTALALAGHLLVTGVVGLLALRALAGAGQAAVVVGAATRALDLAPADRHGEASSYVMVAVQLGFGLGPLFGELALVSWSYDAVWLLAAAGSGVVVMAALGIRRDQAVGTVRIRGVLHPAAVVPGVIFGIGSLGFIGFLAFAPLFVGQRGLAAAAPLFLVCSGTIVVIRVLGARVPDRRGAVTTATGAGLLVIAGLAVLGISGGRLGLYLGVLLLAAGTAAYAPAMALAAVQGIPNGERAQVMATFTMFLDLASAIGPAVLGVLAARAGFGPTFLSAAAAAVLALLLLWVWLRPRLAGGGIEVGDHPDPQPA